MLKKVAARKKAGSMHGADGESVGWVDVGRIFWVHLFCLIAN